MIKMTVTYLCFFIYDAKLYIQLSANTENCKTLYINKYKIIIDVKV